MRVIEMVEVFEARIASGRSTFCSSRYSVHLGLLVLDDRLDDHVAVGQGVEGHAGAEAGQRRAGIRRRHAADLDAALQTLGDGADAFLQGRRHVVEQQGRNAAADVGAGDARTHDAGADDADLMHRLRLHGGVADAGVLLQALGHEEDGDQVARDRAADQRHELLGLDLQALFQRQIAALGDGLEGGQRGRDTGRWSWPAPGAGDGERERQLLLAQADRLLLALAVRLPVVRSTCVH